MEEGSQLTSYSQEVNKHKLLSFQEEQDLAVKVKNGDIEARNTLIISNLRLVIKIAGDYKNQGLHYTDLISAGNLGLTEAANRFEANHDAKFSTFASSWINKYMSDAVLRNRNIIYVPHQTVRKKLMIERKRMEVHHELGYVCDSEVAKRTEFSNKAIRKLDTVILGSVSMDAVVRNNDDGNNEMSIMDTIKDENQHTVDTMISNSELLVHVGEVVKSLNTQARHFVELRFGLNNNNQHTLRGIVDNHYPHMSIEGVRKSINTSLSYIHNELKKPT